jgi:hypothetical protein
MVPRTPPDGSNGQGDPGRAPVTPGERLIMETSDGTLVRKLHAMRAARSVLERRRRRWIIPDHAVGPAGRAR